jgi:hypothetical protein
MRLSFQLIQPTLNSLHTHLLLLTLITRPNGAAVTANGGYHAGFGSRAVPFRATVTAVGADVSWEANLYPLVTRRTW